eukprot:1194488-Prorocentrum_minimum.AAC.5
MPVTYLQGKDSPIRDAHPSLNQLADSVSHPINVHNRTFVGWERESATLFKEGWASRIGLSSPCRYMTGINHGGATCQPASPFCKHE